MLVCDRWEGQFQIPLLVSVISTLASTGMNLRVYENGGRKRNREREGEKERWFDEKSPTTDREQISDSIWNATNPVDRVHDNTKR